MISLKMCFVQDLKGHWSTVMHEGAGKECSQLQSVLSRDFTHLMSFSQDKEMHRR